MNLTTATAFALYRLPGASTAHRLIPDPAGDKTFVFQDFSATQGYELTYEKALPLDFQADCRLPDAQRPFEDGPDSLDEAAYKAALRELIAEQNKGELKKVVFSRYRFESGGIPPFEAFRKLCAAYPYAMVYLWYHRDTGYWLGATPELLLSWSQGELTAMALAGTRARTPASRARGPLWGAKEIGEQRFVTDYIATRLRAFSPDVRAGETQTVQAGNLYHLQTHLRASLPRQAVEAVAQALHPTPAVCGLPRPQAKAFLLEHENYARDFYTGFLGFKCSDHICLYVNLRCAQLYTNGVRYFAGGGITRESQADAEWQETENKIDTLRKIL